MHLEPVTHPGVLEALPTEIGFLNYERSVGLSISELPAVGEGVDKRNNKASRGTQNSSDFLQRSRNIVDIHQHVVRDGEIEAAILERQISRRGDPVVLG
jgi:hypothetical protein